MKVNEDAAEGDDEQGLVLDAAVSKSNMVNDSDVLFLS